MRNLHPSIAAAAANVALIGHIDHGKEFVKFEATARGFSCGTFHDHDGVECSIQDSSAMGSSCIWFGVDDPNPTLLGKPVSYDKSAMILFNDRMHLDDKLIKKEILPRLRKFVKTGTFEKLVYDRFRRDGESAWHLELSDVEQCLRFGYKEANPQICDGGWHPMEFPAGTQFTTQMHLHVDQVKQLIPILERFVKTGSTWPPE